MPDNSMRETSREFIIQGAGFHVLNNSENEIGDGQGERYFVFLQKKMWLKKGVERVDVITI